jgi:hypothetical protein
MEQWSLVKKIENARKVYNLVEWSTNKTKSSINLNETHPTIYILPNKIAENAFEFVCLQ